jgi:hypothetical protein
VILPAFITLLAAVADAEQRRARLHELTNRLGLRDEPAGGDLRARMVWIRDRYPGRGWLRAHNAAWLFLFDTGDIWDKGQYSLPIAGVRDPGLERLLPWFAREVDRGLPILDLPWGLTMVETQGLRHAGDLWPMAVEDARRRQAAGEPVEDFVAHDADNAWLYIFQTTEEETGDPTPLENPLEAVFDEPIALQVQDRRHEDVETVDERDVLHVAIPRLIDWMEATHPDLYAHSFATAWAASEEWHRRFAGTAAFRQPVPEERTDLLIKTWPDGARVVELKSRRALEHEGVAMGHCVGGYWPHVRSGAHRIFSLRDGDKIPLLTIDVGGGTGGLAGHVFDFRGPYNEVPLLGRNTRRVLQALLVAPDLRRPSDHALADNFALPAVVPAARWKAFRTSDKFTQMCKWFMEMEPVIAEVSRVHGDWGEAGDAAYFLLRMIFTFLDPNWHGGLEKGGGGYIHHGVRLWYYLGDGTSLPFRLTVHLDSTTGAPRLHWGVLDPDSREVASTYPIKKNPLDVLEEAGIAIPDDKLESWLIALEPKT